MDRVLDRRITHGLRRSSLRRADCGAFGGRAAVAASAAAVAAVDAAGAAPEVHSPGALPNEPLALSRPHVESPSSLRRTSATNCSPSRPILRTLSMSRATPITRVAATTRQRGQQMYGRLSAASRLVRATASHSPATRVGTKAVAVRTLPAISRMARHTPTTSIALGTCLRIPPPRPTSPRQPRAASSRESAPYRTSSRSGTLPAAAVPILRWAR